MQTAVPLEQIFVITDVKMCPSRNHLSSTTLSLNEKVNVWLFVHLWPLQAQVSLVKEILDPSGANLVK